MSLIDDIEFYGRAVAAGEMDRDWAARLLAEASGGRCTVASAADWIDRWEGTRDRLERMYCDIVTAIRALENGRPIPEHVETRWREDMRRRNRERALRMIRRKWRRPEPPPPDVPDLVEPNPAEAEDIQ